MKKAWIMRFSRVSIDDHLFGDLVSGKINYYFGKSLEKVLEFWIEKSGLTLILYFVTEVSSSIYIIITNFNFILLP